MVKKITITRIMALIGTILVWIPILAPLLFSAVRFFRSQSFQMDYLMPGELFPLVLVGGGLLVWAAFRALLRQRLLLWGFLTAILFLVGGQAYAVVSGIASGKIEAAGVPWGLVMGSFIIYILAIIFIGINGILLLRDLKKIRTCRTDETTSPRIDL